MFTTAQANAILDAYFATERFMSLHSASPGIAGSYAAEVSSSGTGYERQSLLTKLGAATGGLVINTSTISFPVISAAYPIVTSFAAGSALSGGVMGVFGDFNESSLRSVGQSYQFPPGTIRFQIR